MNAKVYIATYIWITKMKNYIIYSVSDRDSPCAISNENQWFTLARDEMQASIGADKNPWNNSLAIIKKKYELLDDCAVSIRPAHSIDPIDKKEHQKGLYFVEIESSSQGKTLSSRKLYNWEDAIRIIAKFEGLSFQAAERVWKVKKL